MSIRNAIGAPSSLGIGVIGLGRMGRVHCHNLSGRVPAARLALVADTDSGVARRVAQQLGVAWSADVDAVITDRRVDAVVIATPPATHPLLIGSAAAAGKPVLCEKPLAYDEEEATTAVEVAARAGVQLQLGFHRRFDRDYASVRAHIEAGDLGMIQTFFTSMRDKEPPPEPVLRRERLLFDAASHDFDAARWLVGEVVAVTAFGTRTTSPIYEQIGEYENVVTVLRFASGTLGVIDNSRATGYGFDCRTEIVGSKATVRIDDPHVTGLEWLTPGAARRDHTPTFLDRFSGAYLAEVEEFVEAVRDDREPSVRGEDGLMAVRLSLAAEHSLRLGVSVSVGQGPGSAGAGRQAGGVLEHTGARDKQ